MSLQYDPLVGRPFTGIGQNDCYALTRDLYKLNFDIDLPNFARPNDWNSDDIDLIGNLHETAGFEKISNWKPKDLRPADLLAMAVNERNPNHLAIYLGDSQMIHQLYGRMSRVEELRGFWMDHTCYLLRHPLVPDLSPVYPDVDLMELLNARNNPSS